MLDSFHVKYDIHFFLHVMNLKYIKVYLFLNTLQEKINFFTIFNFFLDVLVCK